MTVEDILDTPLYKIYYKSGYIITFKLMYNTIEYYLYKHLESKVADRKGLYSSYISNGVKSNLGYIHIEKKFLEKI